MAFVKLTKEQIDAKKDFIRHYLTAQNPAEGSQFDANANVETKNISALQMELNKDIVIQVNRSFMTERLEKLYDKETSDEYMRMINNHEIYIHDETALQSYCASISMYPFLLNGLKGVGGSSTAPHHLNSFCGGFINLVYATASELAGAVATVEFLMYLTKFFIDDYGHTFEENKEVIEDSFRQVVYSMNQPASARGYQSVFWNISMFDKYYYESMFGNFFFPSGATKHVEYEDLDKIQRMFMKWFNNERKRALLTFPVVTVALLNKEDSSGVKDENFADMIATEFSQGNSFFVYQSKSADSLSSCCRLKSELTSNDFSYSLGAGGVATGSIKVITLNINRLVQKGISIRDTVKKVHKFLVAYRSLVQDNIDNRMINIYECGLITIDKQFLTVGINGMIESAEFSGVAPRADTPEHAHAYKTYIDGILGVIYEENRLASKEYGFKFNTEFVPAENLGVKNAKWDTSDGITAKRKCYNSYFYSVEDESVTPLEKFELHGEKFTSKLDGGSALHLNLDQLLDKKQARLLLDISAQQGCYYWCYNVPVTVCEDCGYIHKQPLDHCIMCGSKNVGYATRVIGYLRPVKSFSIGRQIEHQDRFYAVA